MHIDKRRMLLNPGDKQTTLAFCAHQFIEICNAALEKKGFCTVALSGGSTPQALFALLSSPPYNTQTDWGNIHLFWSDERAVPPESPESNYGAAMRSGLSTLPIPKEHIHRMIAEHDIEKNALVYEKTIHKILRGHPFDLITLGLGEDGHIASLFPNTPALAIEDRDIVAQFVPQKNTWRMTMTYSCLHNTHHLIIYVLGDSKASILHQVLFEPSNYPATRLGSHTCPATWIADDAAAKNRPLDH